MKHKTNNIDIQSIIKTKKPATGFLFATTLLHVKTNRPKRFQAGKEYVGKLIKVQGWTCQGYLVDGEMYTTI